MTDNDDGQGTETVTDTDDGQGAVTLTDTDDGQGTVTLTDTDDRRGTVTLTGTDDGLNGDHDSAVSILAELVAGGDLPCGGEEAESCGVRSQVLSDSVSVTCRRCLRFFHML